MFDYLSYSAKYRIYYDLIRLGKNIKNLDDKRLFFFFLNDSVVFNDNGFITSDYRLFLNNYNAFVDPMENVSVKTISRSKDEGKQKLVNAYIEKNIVKRRGKWAEFLTAKIIYDFVITKEEELSAESIDYFSNLTKEKISDKYIQQFMLSMLIKEQKAILERDKIDKLPKSNINSNEFSAGEKLLNEILDKNKGKVIYIDIWATWCGSCMSQFPFVKKLHDLFDGKNVVFVYLCCRSEKEASKNVIKKYQLEGEHYFLDQVQYDFFEKQFSINGIPRYLLYDQNSKLSNVNASRPESEQIITEINGLLNK